MSSPITSGSFDNQHLSDSLCDSFQEKLLNNDLHKQDLDYRVNPDTGLPAATFAIDLLGLALPVGFFLPSPIDIPGLDSEVFLKAEGQQVLKSTYARLFAVYGAAFNLDGDTNTDTMFRVPDMRSLLFGGAGSGTIEEANIAASVGDVGGAKNVDVTLEVPNLPPHKHKVGIESSGGITGTVNDRFKVSSGTLKYDGTESNSLGLTDGDFTGVTDPVTPLTIPTLPPTFFGVWYIKANHKVGGVIV